MHVYIIFSSNTYRVGRATGGGRYRKTVSLDGRQVHVVAKELEQAHVRTRTPVDDEVINDMVFLDGDSGKTRDLTMLGDLVLLELVEVRVGFMVLVEILAIHFAKLFALAAALSRILAPAADRNLARDWIPFDIPQMNRSCFFGRLAIWVRHAAIDGAGQAAAEVDAHAVLHRMREILVVALKIKRGQEAEGAEVERNDGWDVILEKP